MSQTRGSSQHFILHGLFRLGLLKENPGGGQNLGCALGSVSGATGKREELWRTRRCLQNEKWSPLRGCRAAPQHPLGQQVNVRHREPWGGFSFLPEFISGKADWKDWLQSGRIRWGLVKAVFIKSGSGRVSKLSCKVVLLLNSTDSFFLVHPNPPAQPFGVPAWCSHTALPALGQAGIKDHKMGRNTGILWEQTRL